MRASHIVVSETWKGRQPQGTCTRTLSCGLIQKSAYDRISAHTELGERVDAWGSYPTPRDDQPYIPEFKLFGGTSLPDGLEPLVPSWTANNRTVHHPDAGFLMTYGLIPRFIAGEQRVAWDESAKNLHDVVQVDPVSTYEYPRQTVGRVRILRDFLQDYASLRHLCVACRFHERWDVGAGAGVETLLDGQTHKDIVLTDATLSCRKIDDAPARYVVELRGHRLLMVPGPLPISRDAERYGQLNWPGVADPVTHENWRGLGMTYAFVSDAVLERFEGRTEYQLIPECGTVSYGGQWSVDYCRRVCRDLIRIELRKLYEGSSPDIVKHYHEHSVSVPPGEPAQWFAERNIAVRAKGLVFAAAALGDSLAALATQVTNSRTTSADLIKLDRAALREGGWWKAEGVEPICFHAPRNLSEPAFLARCKDLCRLLVEGLAVSHLRATLTALGFVSEHPLASVKCLVKLLALADTAKREGLRLLADRARVVAAMKVAAPEERTLRLFALNDLRQLDAHRPGKERDEKLGKALNAFGIEKASVVPGYGLALDRVYDLLEEELNTCAATMNEAAG